MCLRFTVEPALETQDKHRLGATKEYCWVPQAITFLTNDMSKEKLMLQRSSEVVPFSVRDVMLAMPTLCHRRTSQRKVISKLLARSE